MVVRLTRLSGEKQQLNVDCPLLTETHQVLTWQWKQEGGLVCEEARFKNNPEVSIRRLNFPATWSFTSHEMYYSTGEKPACLTSNCRRGGGG